ALASSEGDGVQSSRVAWPRTTTDAPSPGTTTPTAGRLRIMRAFSVPRPIPNHSRSGVDANSSGVTCGPLEVSTARYANEAPPSTPATFGFQRPVTSASLPARARVAADRYHTPGTSRALPAA